MKIKHYFLFTFLLVFFQSKSILAQDLPKVKARTVSKSKVTKKTKTASLTMTQTTKGKWVIMDSKKTTLYEVFPYDNGPDSPSEGLIRIVKNGKIGYANAKTYYIVIAPQFDCAFPFENGKAKVSNNCKTVKDGEHSIWASDAWQYVDKKGKFITVSSS